MGISTFPPLGSQQTALMQPRPTTAKPTSSQPDSLQSNNGSTLQRSRSIVSAGKEPSQGFQLPETPGNTTEISKQDTTSKVTISRYYLYEKKIFRTRGIKCDKDEKLPDMGLLYGNKNRVWGNQSGGKNRSKRNGECVNLTIVTEVV